MRHAFTLIELLIALVIITIIGSIIVGAVRNFNRDHTSNTRIELNQA